MTLSMYRASVPVFLRGLDVLSVLLDRAVAQGAADGFDAAELVAARLAPDMLPLSGQIQRASDSAKFAAARLTETQPPRFADDETSLADLQRRIAVTADYLGGFRPEQFDGSDLRDVAYSAGGRPRTAKGGDYLLEFALPNFFFHVATAHDILRHNGVVVGKREYLGFGREPKA